MQFLWTKEELGNLCGHKDYNVREWAIETLSKSYPEQTGDFALKLLNDKERFVANAALKFFINYPSEKYSDELIKVYKTASGLFAGDIAGLLAKQNDNRLMTAFSEKEFSNNEDDLNAYIYSVKAISMLNTDRSREIVKSSLKFIDQSEDKLKMPIPNILFWSNLSVGTDVTSLFDFCFKHKDSLSLITILLIEILQVCGSTWYSDKDITENHEKEKLPLIVEEAFEYIEFEYNKEQKNIFEKFFKEENYDEIIKEIYNLTEVLIEYKKTCVEEDAFLEWQRGTSRPRQNILIIYRLYNFLFFENYIEHLKHDDSKQAGLSTLRTQIITNKPLMALLAKTLLSVFARLIEYKDMIGLDINHLNTEDLLRAFLQERGEIEEDDKLISLLADSSSKEKIIYSCIAHANKNQDSLSNLRIVKLMEKLKDIDALAQMLAIDNQSDYYHDQIVLSIEKMGYAGLEIIKPIIERFDEEKLIFALDIISSISASLSADIIIKNWDRLWEYDSEILLETVRGIGDKRFIKLVKNELKDGEAHTAEIFIFLCKINGIIDPELKKAEKIQAQNDKDIKRKLKAFSSNNIKEILNEPLNIELVCRTCKRAYNYKVSKIFVSPETKDILIIDKIICKNCGTLDNYEITEKGLMVITATMIMITKEVDSDRFDPDKSTIIFCKSGTLDGKIMSINEILEYYEKKLKKNPENPEYLIGYANTLRKAKRTEDAVQNYLKAIKVDPIAIETYVSLGQIAEDREDYKTAYSYIKKASEIMDTANYYKVRDDRDEFKVQLINNFLFLEDKLGIKSSVPKHFIEHEINNEKIGRNKPCPCGSGRKYKKCCLGKDSIQKIPEVPIVPDIYIKKEKKLIEQLMDYSLNKKFKNDYLNAMGVYYRIKPVEPFLLPKRADEDKAFPEWVILDYTLFTGKTIIEEFLSEKKSTLTDDEKTILNSHIISYTSIYEIIDIMPGIGVMIKDIFTGEKMQIKDISVSKQAVKWDIIMVRIRTINGISVFLSGSFSVLPRKSIKSLKNFLENEFEKFSKDTGLSTWAEFLKKKAFIVDHFWEDIPDEKPILLTEEKHRIALTKAHFESNDFEKAIIILTKEFDFIEDKYVQDKEAEFSWLKRGKSKEWQESSSNYENGLILKSDIVHESGKLMWTVLGRVFITHGKLVLECFSKERLERGKIRLNEILKDTIKHKIDTLEDIEQIINRTKNIKENAKKVEPSDADDFNRELHYKIQFEQFRKWTNYSIPALNGLTPKDAVKTPEGRQKVIDILKDLENREERRKREGEMSFDVGILRKDLGLE